LTASGAQIVVSRPTSVVAGQGERAARRRERWAIALLLLVAAGQRAWNACSLPHLIGYDSPAHAGYIAAIVSEGRLPHPMSGWSTFHPPFYYLLGSVVWRLLAPFGPQVMNVGLVTIGAVAGLVVAVVSFVLARRFGSPPVVAWTAAALVLFVPCAQLAGAMIGNEALAAGIAALALLPLSTLQLEPRNCSAALRTGLLAGLALATKFTGLSIAAACVVPFVRRDLDRAVLRSLGTLVVAAALVAGPVYARNWLLTGSPVPMTRESGPMRKAEANLVLRPRRVGDYLWIDPACLLRPSIFQVPYAKASLRNRNPSMTNVWGLTYASVWFDPFAVRTSLRLHRDGVLIGPALTLVGIVPTMIAFAGFIAAAVGLLRSGGRSREAPLVVMTLAGLALFVAFTWRAPSTAAVKGSYLLALTAPASVFFAQGVALVDPRRRRILIALSLTAVLAAAVGFTNRLVLTSPPLGFGGEAQWRAWAAQLPESHIDEAMSALLGSR
jgi:hypothetical protein